MPIRLSGMASGLDTDAIVKELAASYSKKKESIQKKQTKLEWTQDAWKSMNTKIYSFYTSKLSGMRFSGSYNKKTASVSNSSVAKVTASSNAVNGTQQLKVKELATSGYLTGGEIGGSEGKSLSGSSKLSEIAGMESFANGAVELKVGGKTKKIELSADMTINQFVTKLKDAGVNANFDDKNNRFFLSAIKSGSEGDFALTGSDANGNLALQKMGLFSMNKDSAEWKKYEADANLDIASAVETAFAAQKTADTTAEAEQKALEKEQKSLNSKVDSYNNSIARSEAKAELLGMLQFEETGTRTDSEGNEITEYGYAAGSPTRADVKAAAESRIEAWNQEIANLADATGMSDEDKAKAKAVLESRIAGANEVVTALDNDVLAAGDFKGMLDKAGEDKTAAETSLSETNSRLSVVNNALNGGMEEYVENRNREIAEQNEALRTRLTDYYTELKNNAAQLIAENTDDPDAVGKASGAIKITGNDAEIELNGATFKNSTNTFSINGLTIQATAKTGDEAVTITTDTDIDGIYNMVKDFFSSYNELIKSMDSAYNAASSKGYEPLTDEEKDAMTDTEVEKWEKKIKDSLLRKDNTLGNLSSLMKNAMAASYEVGGKKLSLASFGIKSSGYFAADSSERGMYHIDGDPDDDTTSGNEDKLRAAIAKDPNQVVEFLSKLSANMYNQLTSKMSSSSLSSAYTVYNDKQMKTQYSKYTSDIKSWEDKIAAYEDRYYKQFAAMEKALASLNSQTSQLSGLFGK